MGIRSYDVTFRANYEFYAAGAWIASGGLSTLAPILLDVPQEPYLGFLAVSVALAARRLPQGLRLLQTKKRLQGADLTFINLEKLKPIIERYKAKDALWLGYGWEWDNQHTQLVYELTKRSKKEVLDFERNPNKKGAAWLHGLDPNEEEIAQPLSHTAGHVLIVGTTGSGKAQPLHALVHTPKGWKQMGDIMIGDIVSTPDGEGAIVEGVFPQGRIPVYRFTFEDSRQVEACADHLWEIHHDGWPEGHRVIDTKALLGLLPAGGKYQVPLSDPVEKTFKMLALPPYLLGRLMRGELLYKADHFALSASDEELDAAARLLMPDKFHLRRAMCGLGLCGLQNWDVFIPKGYMEGCIEQRWQLMCGLLDADGDGTLITSSEQLAHDVQELAWSLGGTAVVTQPDELASGSRPRYQVVVRHARRDRSKDADSLKLRIVAIDYVGDELSQCIAIDHPRHLYLTNDYVVTHNTRMFDHLITQAIMRGNEAVIIVDPKGDKELCDNARLACKHSGDESRFKYFHPAFPEKSVRLDPLRNFNRATELASRIAVLMASEQGNPFQAFGQMALNNVCQGLLTAGDRPNLVKVRSYLEGGTDSLVVRAIAGYCDKNVPNWESIAAPYLAKASTTEKKAHALIRFYRDKVQNKSPDLEGLFSMFEHDREHFQKMIASLLPIMNMLTSGDLGPLLSPDSDDLEDTRPITDSARIIRNNQVLYIGLDSLSDSMVGSAIGSIILSDLTAVAGDRYNYGCSNNRVNLYVDETSEVVNLPLIQTLNKGRGAGYCATLATQTFADFASALGDENKARQVLGNLNNIISLRVTDAETQEYICKSLPKTRVKYVMQTQGTNSASATGDAHSGNIGERLMEEEVELVSPAMLGQLPDLEFFARLVDGRLMKGRLPILTK